MPITVPRGPAPASREGPSDTDLLMAMATMERLGRLPTFDERFRGHVPLVDRLDPSLQGQIEDRRQDEDELAAQEAASRKLRMATIRPQVSVMATKRRTTFTTPREEEP